MRTLIHEIGVIDKYGKKHPVNFREGLNVVTGKSSTGKSALIEIFDYCFGSSENTIPKGVITDSAEIYYVALSIEEQNIVIARNPELIKKAFFRRLEIFNSDNIDKYFFSNNYFRPIDEYKKYLRSFFLDIDDVDESLTARANRRYNAKSATPSIRSFSSFMLQHQNLVANKHALFYRFDEKEKRDQVIDHTKIFIGLVDQQYFHLSQEYERLTDELKRLERQQKTNKLTSDIYKQNVSPVLNLLYDLMGFKKEPLAIKTVLSNPQDAKKYLDKLIVPENIDHCSDAVSQRYNHLNLERTKKTSLLRKLQRQESSIKKHIQEDERLIDDISKFETPKSIYISASVCPFCHTEKNSLDESAEKLQQAIVKISGNLTHAKPMKAKFESSLIEVKRNIEMIKNELFTLSQQIAEIEEVEKQLIEQKSLYENVLIQKAKLFILLDTLNMANDIELDKKINELNKELKNINKNLKLYDVKKGLEDASNQVNNYMDEIGKHFEFEKSYQPINLRFSFETFDLYHLYGDEKIYLRSMGSGANWLYSHVTLFLALHKYFAELGNKCSIPSILFLDQPTQVYFPNFNRDDAETFKQQTQQEAEQRTAKERSIDEDMKAVENLFSQLSIYCDDLKKENGFSPQIIVTDHADGLTLSGNSTFEALVNGNRWRTRGLINPVIKNEQ
ncbi:DUF3732 domain-containing protein [Proteus vulgaris]|uniref:DUF3732 domain-containing protein n=1 Tax=Proteus vulgaris TaxID=585 RepID=UPI00236110C1|nr:DUF3732 domain-containing protein [Proteus vulgaris]